MQKVVAAQKTTDKAKAPAGAAGRAIDTLVNPPIPSKEG